MGGRPNVVVIVLDTVRQDHSSAFGYDIETTPALEEFANGATRFTDAISQAGWSIPSHASLLTGQYPSDHGATTVRPVLEVDRTLPALLSGAGYETCAVSGNGFVRPTTGFGRGFDEFRPSSHLEPPDSLVSKVSPALNWVASSPVSRRPVERLFNAFQDSTAAGGPLSGTKRTMLESVRDVLRGAAEPFFLFVNLFDAHLPRSPDQPHAEQFVDDELADVEVAVSERAQTFENRNLDSRRIRKMRQLYDADLRSMDDKLGQLFDLLRARSVLDESLVVVVSDHGEHLGEFGLVGHQHSVFEPVVSVPLVVQFPDGGPRWVDEQVETRRVFDTVLDEAGIASCPERTLASGTADEFARGAFYSPMLDLEQFIWEGNVVYDKQYLGEPLSFVRAGPTKRVQFAGTEWTFDLSDGEETRLHEPEQGQSRTGDGRPGLTW